MNIQKRIVTNANWTAGRDGHNVNKIIIHTEVGNQSGSESRFNNPQSQVSVHYGVGFDGAIRQWVEENNTAYQAGNWAVNLESIGIEHEDFGDYNGVRPDSLYNASSDLVADICRRYGIPCDRAHIFKHSEVINKTQYPGGTACPDALDIDRIVRETQAKLNPPAPAPTPAPSTPPILKSTYERIPQTRYVTIRDAKLWDLNATTWAGFMPIKIIPKNTEFIAVGDAHHPLGGVYMMTAYSFGNADQTGVPIHNSGVNQTDLVESPLPPPTTADAKPLPQMQPLPIPTATESPAPSVPVDGETIPVNVVPVDFKQSWNGVRDVYEANTDYTITDLDGKLPDMELHKNQIVKSVGRFTKGGITYHRVQKWVDADVWYGIDESVLDPHDDPSLFHVDVSLKDEARKYFHYLTTRQKINAIAGIIAGTFKRLGVFVHVVKVK